LLGLDGQGQLLDRDEHAPLLWRGLWLRPSERWALRRLLDLRGLNHDRRVEGDAALLFLRLPRLRPLLRLGGERVEQPGG
jgi:hypothetical protein